MTALLPLSSHNGILVVMNSGKVVALHLKPRPGELRSVDSLNAISGKGFEGDRCFGQGSRQALIISTENLNELDYKPGDLREQITIDLPGLQAMQPGARIKIGTCTLAIEGNCAPCDGMAKRLQEDPAQFKEKTSGKRGMLANVIEDGVVKVGDEVRFLGA